jgi:glycosyltransferase involved in cell wall biosynthesis
MLIAVANCTVERTESLRPTPHSLAAMLLPYDLDWEVVVTNNGSTDHTDKVVKAFAGRPLVRRELEPQRGMIYFRNRAVDAANTLPV